MSGEEYGSRLIIYFNIFYSDNHVLCEVVGYLDPAAAFAPHLGGGSCQKQPQAGNGQAGRHDGGGEAMGPHWAAAGRG